MKTIVITLISATALSGSIYSFAGSNNSEKAKNVADSVISKQREILGKSTQEQGFGPQSPRDLEQKQGANMRTFSLAPSYTEMNLCNIHFHKNAEHKGGEFTQFAGNGDGEGYGSGYQYTGVLSEVELVPVEGTICPSTHGGLSVGDTIEVHYVHSSAKVKPGATLNACLNESIKNPDLRVEAQVLVLVNDKNALDFNKLTAHGMKGNRFQALNIPSDTGLAVQYAGSTTGPSFNEKGSPLQVSWSVRPQVAKVDITTLGQWCNGNAFDEDHAHGVRNLVINPALLSKMK